MAGESREAALFHVFYERLRFLVLADRLNQVAPELYRGYFSLLHLPVNPVARILEEGDPGWMPGGRTVVVGRALEEAVAFLERELGAEERWAWGALHALTLRHPLGTGRDWRSRLLNRILQFNRGPFPPPPPPLSRGWAPPIDRSWISEVCSNPSGSFRVEALEILSLAITPINYPTGGTEDTTRCCRRRHPP